MTDEKKLTENGARKLDDALLDEVVGGRRYTTHGLENSVRQKDHSMAGITEKAGTKLTVQC